MKRILVYISVAAAVLSCQKEAGVGSVEVEDEVIYLPAEGGIKHVLVDATTEWRLEYDTSTSWMSTDLHGGKPNRKYFTISFLENPNTSARTCRIKVYTSDRNDSKDITVIQRRQPSAIQFSVEELEIECWAGTYSMDFSDNIIDKSGIRFSGAALVFELHDDDTGGRGRRNSLHAFHFIEEAHIVLGQTAGERQSGKKHDGAGKQGEKRFFHKRTPEKMAHATPFAASAQLRKAAFRGMV